MGLDQCGSSASKMLANQIICRRAAPRAAAGLQPAGRCGCQPIPDRQRCHFKRQHRGMWFFWAPPAHSHTNPSLDFGSPPPLLYFASVYGVPPPEPLRLEPTGLRWYLQRTRQSQNFHLAHQFLFLSRVIPCNSGQSRGRTQFGVS